MKPVLHLAVLALAATLPTASALPEASVASDASALSYPVDHDCNRGIDALCVDYYDVECFEDDYGNRVCIWHPHYCTLYMRDRCVQDA